MESIDKIFFAYHQEMVQLADLILGNIDAAHDAIAEAFACTYPKYQNGTSHERSGPSPTRGRERVHLDLRK